MKKELEEKIVSQYQRDEGMMILVFAQWCVNQGLDPQEVYKKAYPHQVANPMLSQMVELTVPKEEAGEIPDQTVLNVLSMFGNEELAFVVSQEMERLKKEQG
ncbi:hypothetical protein [Ammoniphilus sp. CFH 90114]|uniref:hypothetical protein n=1 Tax=Ammoniphilus sp. CFH 90114 TaxID=2493665 RepID=UPI00100EC754|nr:hypothetical protein [Ammoniphilus sp. CFH 90114]RXT04259.1 hypothetical protein EIZ39_20465 [Ammoniphilus sp. CFH 90114]